MLKIPKAHRSLLAVAALALAAAGVAGAYWAGKRSVERYYVPYPVDEPVCGVVAVETVCRLYGIETNLSEIYRDSGMTREGTTLLGCKRALEARNVTCTAVRFRSCGDLPQGMPIICVFRAKGGPHAVVIVRKPKSVVLIDGPRISEVAEGYVDNFTEHWALLSEYKNKGES